MSWTETHRRWEIVQQVLADLEVEGTGRLPWREEYAEVFGDRAGLLAALRYRWQLTSQAQLGPDVDARLLETHRRELVARHAGLLRLLARHPEGERLAQAS